MPLVLYINKYLEDSLSTCLLSKETVAGSPRAQGLLAMCFYLGHNTRHRVPLKSHESVTVISVTVMPLFYNLIDRSVYHTVSPAAEPAVCSVSSFFHALLPSAFIHVGAALWSALSHTSPFVSLLLSFKASY